LRAIARRSPAVAGKGAPAVAGGWEGAGVAGAARSGATSCARVARVGQTYYLIRMPEMARAMTRRWISEVPSKMV
jgi:hypothetical protein